MEHPQPNVLDQQLPEKQTTELSSHSMHSSKRPQKPVKDRAARAKEGITLLQKIREMGVTEFCVGWVELKDVMRTWINDGPAWSGRIDFPGHLRYADIILPVNPNRVANIAFKVYR